jgi:hypothetical protein
MLNEMEILTDTAPGASNPLPLLEVQVLLQDWIFNCSAKYFLLPDFPCRISSFIFVNTD